MSQVSVSESLEYVPSGPRSNVDQSQSNKPGGLQAVPFQTNPTAGINSAQLLLQNAAITLPKGSTSSVPNSPTDVYAPLLAASYRNNDNTLDVPSASLDYLSVELNVERLNSMHKRLWLVGRPMPPRALHHQRLLGREVILTERMDMHMVWSGNQIFLKPIPRFLFEPHFWTEYLSCDDQCYVEHSLRKQKDELSFCKKQTLRRCALGFLISYTALVSYESDFHIARDKQLLPEQVDWLAWKTFVKELLGVKPIYTQINKRFIYGELRLNRLNIVCRLDKGPIRGYQPEYSQYGSFFSANFTWLASLLAYIVIILSAMQVGLGTTALQNNESFQAASYGFTVFSIVGPLAAVAIILIIFLVFFVGNWVDSSNYEKKRLHQLQSLEDPH